MSLKEELSKGILTNFLTKYSNVFIQIVLGMILARLLTPKEFGIVAVVQVFVTFFNLLSDMGLGPAVIQKKLNKKEETGIFYLSILMGIVSSVAFYSLAEIISNFYDDIVYFKIVKLLSISIFFFTLTIVPLALNRKYHRFKLVGIIEIISGLIGGIISIFFSFKGYSYFAIIYGTIIRSFILFIVNFSTSTLKLTFDFEINGIKKVLNYSMYQFLFNFINYFSRNLDNILIGKFLGSAFLGLYDKAYKLMLYPVSNLTGVFTPVIHPILSKHQNDKEIIYKTYSKMVKILALIGIPLSVYLYFSAAEIILIMYGQGWEGSIPVFKILACTVWIQVILSSSGSIFQAAGNTKYLFISGVLSAATMCSGIIYGISRGSLTVIGYGLIIAFSINFLQGYYILIKKVLKQNYFEFLLILVKPLIIGLISFSLFFLYSLMIEVENIFISFIIKSIIALIGFMIGIFITKEYKLINELRKK